MCLLSFCIFISSKGLAPAVVLALGEDLFGGVVGGIPQPCAADGVGHELLAHEVAGIVVGVEIVGAVAEFFHERCGGVAQMQGHGEVAAALYFGQGCGNAYVGGVALGACGEIDGAFGKWDAAFGHAYLMQGVEGGVGQEQGVGVGEAYVFGCEDDEATCYELGVFASGYHACEPVEGGVGVGAAYAFDECRHDVVVHLSAFVVGLGVLLEVVGDVGVVDDNGLAGGGGLLEQFEDVEQLARVAACVAEQGYGGAYVDSAVGKHAVGGECVVEQALHLCFVERFERVHLRARQQRAYDFERGVFGGGADERDYALLDGSEQAVLLVFAETVYFVDEQYGTPFGEHTLRVAPAQVDDFAHVFDSGCDGRKRVETALCGFGYDARKGGFADSRRPPQDEGCHTPRLNHAPEHSAGSHKVGLADVVVEILRAHPLRQWCKAHF